MDEIASKDLEEFAPRLVMVHRTGLLIASRVQEIEYRGNPEFLKDEVMDINIKNLIGGWWSLSSLFMNPVDIIGNILQFEKYKKDYAKFMADPEAYIIHQNRHEVNKLNPGTLIFYSMAGIIFILCVVVVISAL